MLRYFLFAVPLAALIMLAGCDESNQGYASSGRPPPSRTGVAASPAAPASAQAAAPAPAQPAPASSRFSTTQSLPPGYGYMHEQDLVGGRITSAGSSTQPYIVTQPQAAPEKGS